MAHPKGSALSKIATGLLDAAKHKVDSTISETKRKVAAEPARFGAFVALAANAALGKVGKPLSPLAAKLIGNVVTMTVTEMVRSNVKPKPNWK